MGLDTLDEYRLESETERGGWRGLLGTILTFVGFIVLANAFVIALFFRHNLALRYQLICSVLGTLVGLLGMWLRGNNRAQIGKAAAVSVAAIITMVLAAVMEARFGWWGMIAVMAVIGWLLIKVEEYSWKKL